MTDHDADARPESSSVGRARRWVPRVTAVVLGVLVGAVLGFLLALVTPAHVEIAGSEAAIRLAFGTAYDQFGLNGLVSGKHGTGRSVLGEPVGVHVSLDLDASTLVSDNGSFNADVLPAYIQAFSDPDQVVADIRGAVIRHTLWFTGTGAVLGLLAVTGRQAYVRWRTAHDRRVGVQRHVRSQVWAYHAPERAFARWLAGGLAVAAVLNVVPGGMRVQRPPVQLRTDPHLAGTPLADIEIDGVLRPAIVAVESYIETYFSRTNTYYDQLRQRLQDELARQPVELPGAGKDVVRVGFVTDRHCNIGMDRVIVELLQHFDVQVLVSGGDDDFSGTFPFESACTRNLAEKSQQAGMTDVFVSGNHDSLATRANERDQRIQVLEDKIVTVEGVHFLGDPDPRASRYGQGIQPSSADERHRVLTEQGRRIGALACASKDKMVVVVHDPDAGDAALRSGCGHAVLALDGHTHHQAGPNSVVLPDGSTGYQFVGGSSGGATTEDKLVGSFGARLTVGPLNHPASVNIVSIDRSSGALVGVTVASFTPQQAVTIEQHPVPAA